MVSKEKEEKWPKLRFWIGQSRDRKLLRNTSNRQLVDRQMGKGASSGHQLLGVSLVVLWHFDETIFRILKSYHMVKEQSNMNHVTKITWHKKSSRQDKINKLLLIIQKFLSVHRHPLRQHILKIYFTIWLTTLKNDYLCWDGMTLGEQLRWISVYVQWTLGHRFSIRNPIIFNSNVKIRTKHFSSRGKDGRTWLKVNL